MTTDEYLKLLENQSQASKKADRALKTTKGIGVVILIALGYMVLWILFHF